MIEPVPLPVRAKAPGLLEADPSGPDAALWRVFRRYLFDYRAEFTSPLALLVDSQNRAVKVYATVPNPTELRADAAGQPRPLPFEGRYAASKPSRDYFKLGAAFFWAGHADQAVPYLEEVLRRTPDNERALMAIAQIHLDAGRIEDARSAIRKLLEAPPADPLHPAESRHSSSFPWPQPSDPEVRVQNRLAEGDPAEEALRLAEVIHCDLIVIGSHGRKGLARLLTGSVAEEVLRKAACPVLIMKAPQGAAPAEDLETTASPGEVVDVTCSTTEIS